MVICANNGTCYVYIEIAENEFDRYPVSDLERVMLVYPSSKEGGAYLKEGGGGRIYGYDIEKVKATRPEIIDVVDPSEEMKEWWSEHRER